MNSAAHGRIADRHKRERRNADRHIAADRNSVRRVARPVRPALSPYALAARILSARSVDRHAAGIERRLARVRRTDRRNDVPQARSDSFLAPERFAHSHDAVRADALDTALSDGLAAPDGLAAHRDKMAPAVRKSEPAAPSNRTVRDQRGADRMPAAARDLDRARNQKMDRSVRSDARVRRADRRPADFRHQRTAGDTDHWAGIVWSGCRPACPFFTTLESGSALVARIAVSIPAKVTTACRPFTSFPLVRPRRAWTSRRPARSRRPAPGPTAPRSVVDYLL